MEPIDQDPVDPFFRETFPWLSRVRRAYLYRILLAVGGLAVLVGYATEETVVQVLGYLGLLIGNGTAVSFTPRP